MLPEDIIAQMNSEVIAYVSCLTEYLLNPVLGCVGVAIVLVGIVLFFTRGR